MYKSIPVKTVDHGHDSEFNNEQLVSIIHRLVEERDELWRENEYLKAKLNESVLIETINEMKRERDVLLKLLLNLSNNNNNNNHQHNNKIHKEEQYQQSNYYAEEHVNGFSNDMPPPPAYQSYNTTPNGKILRNSPITKKVANQVRHNNQPETKNRDVSIPITESKLTSRRSNRSKPHADRHQLQPQTQPTAVYRVEGTKQCLMNPDELSSVFAHVKHSHPNKKIVVYKTSTTPQTHEFNQLVDEMCVKHGVELKHSQNSPFQQYRSQSLQDLTTSTSLPTQRTFDFQFQPIERLEQTRSNYMNK